MPSAPAWMATTTRSAFSEARWMSRRAAGRSVSEPVFGYGAKPRNAIRKSFTCMIVISPGMPVWAIPARWSARTVSSSPAWK